MVIDLMYIFYGFLMFVSNRRSHLHAAHVSADLCDIAASLFLVHCAFAAYRCLQQYCNREK